MLVTGACTEILERGAQLGKMWKRTFEDAVGARMQA